MCVSVQPANFGGTTISINPAIHPVTGKPIHVLGYQNTAQNLAYAGWGGGGNAMLLHFPSWGMTQENVVDTSGFKHCLDDMVEAVQPINDMLSFGTTRSIAKSAVHVFEHDIYTVVLTSDAGAISKALAVVPESRRPHLNLELFAWYGDTFPNHSFALCCFNNREAKRANPMLWWYEPQDPEDMTLPALDAHTGNVPRFDHNVVVDHWVIVGSREKKPSGQFEPVRYRDQLDDFAKAILPTHVMGKQFRGSMPNGDFFVRHGANGIEFERGLAI